MSYTELMPILLAIIGSLCAILLAIISWWLVRMDTKIDRLSTHRESCLTLFASKEDNDQGHAALWEAINKIRLKGKE